MNVLIAATLITIRFVGLAAFSDVIEPKKRLAILPRADGTNVEPHTALIAFPTGTARPKNWTVQPLPALKGYDYVLLDGERVTVTLGRGAKATDMPSLPSMRTCCPRMGAGLAPRFTPKSGYAGAAAVLEMPSGRFRTCSVGTVRNELDPNPTTVNVMGRVDTLLWDEAKSVTFTAVKGSVSRELVVRASAYEILVMNAPAHWVEHGHGTAARSHAHSDVYYAMGDQQSRNPLCRPISDCVKEATTASCADPAARPGGQNQTPAIMPPELSDPQFMTNPDCSNSLWP